MFFFDTETCGFTGPTVLIQYADDDGPVTLHEVWRRPVRDTLDLIERSLDSDAYIGFNLTFDHFHFCKDYNVLRLLNPSEPPDPKKYLANERRASEEALCLKPRAPMDLMLHARKGRLQTTMARREIRIKRVPVALARELADHLTTNLEFDEIYFARRADGYEWLVDDRHDENFPDIVLKFAPSGGLKAIAKYELGRETIELPWPEEAKPNENLWNPFAERERGWPKALPYAIMYWHTDELARRYAELDVVLTRELYDHFDCPEPGDHDSVLACSVGAARWRGFSARIDECERLIPKLKRKKKAAPTYRDNVIRWLHQVMEPIEQAALNDTRDDTLELISKWRGHPAAERAKAVREARSADKYLDTVRKLVHVGSWHPDFIVIGTKTDRMAGTGKFNATGIPRIKFIRELFDLAGEGEQLDGGDFSSFEVSLAAAHWGDPQLDKDLAEGIKIHAVFGAENYQLSDLDTNVIPDMPGDRPLTYEEVLATAGTDNDLYGTAKNGVFSLIFMAQPQKLAVTLGVPLARAERGFKRFWERYPTAAKNRNELVREFTALSQPGGIGTQVVWNEPKEYVETLLGFKRWFTLEWKVVKFLFDLASKPPKEWSRFKDIKIRRRDRDQTPGGAIRSALYACCFALQGDIQRQAANTPIQGTGAQINKALQVEAWTAQPFGVHSFKIRTLNVHDETLTVHDGTVNTQDIADRVVERYRDRVPFLRLDWVIDASDWAAVKG